MNQFEYVVTVRGEIPKGISEKISHAHADAVRIKESTGFTNVENDAPIPVQGESHE